MTDRRLLQELLDAIDPKRLAYHEWLEVGMALKEEGGTPDMWAEWSKRDPERYHEGECHLKWKTFSGTGITGATMTYIAKAHGWRPHQQPAPAIDWDTPIELPDEEAWCPVQDLIDYLSTCFEATEYVSIVTKAHKDEKTGRFRPGLGVFNRTAQEIIEALKASNSIEDAIGPYNTEAGAWIRVNPVDGKGQRTENITSYRHALIESDSESIEKQIATYKALRLPIAALVHSGNHSAHAIVRVGATSEQEHRERFLFICKVLKDHGLDVDQNNKDVARLSRLPGVIRGSGRQYLIATNIGFQTYEEWRAYIEDKDDALPQIESLADVFDSLPALAPPLIDGVLRVGHKMLLSGPSKAGKSFALLQLVIALAEGGEWLGWQCAQGRVLYVNFELDRASCLHRIKDIYTAKNIKPENLNNIDIWNLRGMSQPLDQLAPRLIRRAQNRNYIAIVLDPIYKVITGDENAADKMAYFCNQFDRISHALNCAVIYCHHHSKGIQAQKISHERASGSGVFARDPDAILDIIELVVEPEVREKIINKAILRAAMEWADENIPDWRKTCPDLSVQHQIMGHIRHSFPSEMYDEFYQVICDAQEKAQRQTAWRMEGTLREFPAFGQKRFWFSYPIHVVDTEGLLDGAAAVGEEAYVLGTRQKTACANRVRSNGADGGIALAFDAISNGRPCVSVEALAGHMSTSIDNVLKALRFSTAFTRVGQNVWLRRALMDKISAMATSMTDKEIADEFGVSDRTIRRWLKESTKDEAEGDAQWTTAYQSQNIF